MEHRGKRLLLLATKTGYQTRAFAEAAARLGVEMSYATDRCHVLEDPWGDRALPLQFEDPEHSAAQIAEFARTTKIDGIISLGDRPTPTAARAAQMLGLPFHPPEAADLCSNKFRFRQHLRNAGFPVPRFCRYELNVDFPGFMPAVEHGLVPPRDFPGFPCVLKPLAFSGSRGVIRANNPAEAAAASERIRALLRLPEVQVLRDEEALTFIQVEQYIDGAEVAVEGVVRNGRLYVLAIFDKPDPLTGPYFEETIYVTPSRIPAPTQAAIATTLRKAIDSLGLSDGPIHAELRLPDGESLTILEIAARCIGGLCARALRFEAKNDAETCGLEELLIRAALGEDVSDYRREPQASGVMMIPIPAAGIYQDVAGVEQALATPDVQEIYITAKQGQKLVPLPEGASYLGFIFARAETSEGVELALRAAHERLRFTITPALPVVAPR